MKFVLSARDLSGWTCLLIGSLLVTGCTPNIKGWSQEAYRSPGFSTSLLGQEGLALLPVMVVTAEPVEAPGRTGQIASAPYSPEMLAAKDAKDSPLVTTDAYRISLSEALLSKIRTKMPGLDVVSPGDCLKRINDAGITAGYLKFDRDCPRVGVDEGLLKAFGQALDCRYLFVSQAIVAHVESEASVTVVWTFGRKSVLQSIRISGHIWDTVAGGQIWEGSGVGYNRLRAYEGAPLTEDVIDEAVERLLQAMLP
jgi:hypothetical protein